MVRIITGVPGGLKSVNLSRLEFCIIMPLLIGVLTYTFLFGGNWGGWGDEKTRLFILVKSHSLYVFVVFFHSPPPNFPPQPFLAHLSLFIFCFLIIIKKRHNTSNNT